ncbi:hypothetical protein Trco_000529 [Trichoderma cornu-damae]|uniref:Extracellular matrix protein n=1 Tax=Trichoderma cornu-damae TaxID=654480 RepID=A0A9P8U0E8_9HYPO|nr:hypothetical protein Trco_000529 [Trichoderma cornu-damae]
MKYSIAAVTAFVAVAFAKPQFLNSAFQVEEGKPFTLKYSGCDSGCIITLQTGASSNLKDVKVLATSVTGDSTTVTLEDLPSGVYSFKITDSSGQSNYSQQFSYQGTGTVSVSSAPTATSAQKTSATTEAATTESATTEAATTESTTTEAATTEESTTLVKSTKTTQSTTTTTTTEASSTTTTQVAHTSTSKLNTTTVASTTVASTTTGEHTTTAASTSSHAAITTVPPGSAAGRLSSPLALVAGVALAIAFFS